MCAICNNDFQGLTKLTIRGCHQITEIPNTPGLSILNIDKCSKLIKIPNIQGLKILSIKKVNFIYPILPCLSKTRQYRYLKKH